MALSSVMKRVAAVGLIVFFGVEAHAKGSSRTRLVTASPSPAGQSVSMTAEVDALGAGRAPGGRVTFFDGATPLGWAPLNPVGAGQATLAAGPVHACAVTSAGGVKCWGWNAFGQLGDGTATDRATPVDVIGLSSGVVALAAGAYHTCALTNAGAVECWGDNSLAQLGDTTGGRRRTRMTVPGLSSGVVAIAAGFAHSCALTAAGRVMCWGHNANGQLGNGESTMFSPPTLVGGPATIYKALAADAWRSCGVTGAGAVRCWGADYGALPVAVAGLETGVAALADGFRHHCALTVAGAVKCWGDNYYGQLGDGTTVSRPAPVQVAGLTSGAVAVEAADYHTCALLSSGAVRCWGFDDHGQLGDGATTARSIPTPVAKLGGSAVAIATGYSYSCALLSPSRVLRCWGQNDLGQIGDGTTTDRLLPVATTGFVGLLRARGRLHAPLAAGRHLLRANYSGDADHPASASPVVPHEVR
ncbi:MAG TPA: chromosome condensation regulator RCC1 [Methylosinus sp.]